MAAATTELASILDSLGELDDRAFHRFEYDLVERYRRHEAEQEAIAVTVMRYSLGAKDARTRERIDELLAMLDSTHDPLI